MRKIDRLEIEIDNLINIKNDEHHSFVIDVVRGNVFDGNIYDSQNQIKEIMLKYKIEVLNLKKMKECMINMKKHDMRKKRVREIINDIEEAVIMAKGN